MRVTGQMIAATILNNLSNNEKRMLDIQNKLSSGHNIARPSDDPVVAVRVMGLNTNVAANSQYKKNIDDAQGWLQITDQALANIGDALRRARQLTLQGVNGTLSDTDRKAVAAEIDQLIQNVIDNANTNFGGRYIFGGTNTTKRPFEINGEKVIYNGSQEPMNWEISQGVQLTVNTIGARISKDQTALSIANNSGESKTFSSDNTDNNLFTTLLKIKSDIQSSDTADLQKQITSLDKNIDNILSLRATIGAKENRLDASKTQSTAAELNLKTVRSNLYDIDLAKTYTDLNMQQNAYQAALIVAARIIQPSLVDFLK